MQDINFRQFLPLLAVAGAVFVVIAVLAVIWEYKEEICLVIGLLFVGGVMAAAGKRGGARRGGRTLNVRIVR